MATTNKQKLYELKCSPMTMREMDGVIRSILRISAISKMKPIYVLSLLTDEPSFYANYLQ
jgi:hypothetical protein